MYRISAVVPTYKRPDHLARCLDALLAQDLDPTAYEIIIADDAASEQTRRQVRCWADRAGASGRTVRYLAVSGAHGPAAARNAGWRAAHGAIVAFTDDDCMPRPSWLRAGLAAFEQGAHGVMGLAGRVVVPSAQYPTDYEHNAALLETAEFVTANCFYRRSMLEEVGGFDESFTAAWREDSDLFFTLLERGARLASSADAVVVHPIRRARWGVSVRQQRKSLYNALLYKKHPSLYRERIQPAPPWHYYGIVGALVAILAGSMVGWRTCALAGLGAWLLMTARFCLRRLRHTSRAPRHVAEMAITSAVIPPLALFWRLRGALKFRVFFL